MAVTLTGLAQQIPDYVPTDGLLAFIRWMEMHRTSVEVSLTAAFQVLNLSSLNAMVVSISSNGKWGCKSANGGGRIL